MNKSSLSIIAKILSDKRGLSQADAEKFIKQMFSVANDALHADKQVKMRWLGTFKVQSVKDRESVDVNTGERIVIEGRDKIAFTPDNILREIVNKPFAQFETVVVNDGVDFSDIDEKFARMEGGSEEENDSVPPVAEERAAENASVANPVIEETPIVEDKKVEEPSVSQVVSFDVPEIDTKEKEEDISSSDVIVIADAPVSASVPENVEKVTVVEEESHTSDEEEKQKEETVEEAVEKDSRHLVIPKYWVVVACLAFVLLLGGMCWFAFNYGMMQAQRDHLATQLDGMKNKPQTVAKPKVVPVDSTQAELREKARQDSIRLSAANKAVQMAEKTEKLKAKEKEVGLQEKQAIEKEDKTTDKKKVDSNKSHYDNDPRVRTGAYRIVGIAQTVTVKEGQSLQSISKHQLGPGMECYIEAVNGHIGEVKAGQKIKIPKLELKKKSK